jgi:hypothetical protein
MECILQLHRNTYLHNIIFSLHYTPLPHKRYQPLEMKACFPSIVLVALSVVLRVSTEARLGSNEWTLAENQDASIAELLGRNIQHNARTDGGCSAEATHVGVSSGAEVHENSDITAPSEGILSIWFDKLAASELQPAEVAAHSSEEISKLWPVCSQCSNEQIESCLLTTAMDAPSKTYDASADVFHAADTYDCLVSTIGCCAA